MKLAVLLLGSMAACGQSLTGLWDATIQSGGLTVPFRFEIETSGDRAAGSFFNGDEKVTSSAGSFNRGVLRLNYDYLATTLEARLNSDSALDGVYGREGRQYPFHARRFAPSRLTEASAAILRVDGDTGTLAGTFRDGKFVLSHFSGARPSVVEITPKPDGTLEVVQNGRAPMTAVRSSEAKAKGLPQPADPSRHTTMKDPTEPFHFRFQDLDGNIVADSDARFRGKVLIVAIGGSWCPNCHDEAPFLVDLYRRYHSRGLELVDLSFEEADQLKDPARLRAFVRQYGIEYPVLLAGEPGQLNAKLPQAVNLNAWPTTFYIGRDGRVRSVHAGFAARASGQFHDELRREVTALVEKLLSEN